MLSVAFPVVTRTDFLVFVFLVYVAFLIYQVRNMKLPDPAILQNYSTISNTKGGIILILLFLWLFTLILMTAFCVWVIVKGINPQNAVVVMLLGVLSGNAFGNVNGAFFKTMTGEDPKMLLVPPNPPAPVPPIAPAEVVHTGPVPIT